MGDVTAPGLIIFCYPRNFQDVVIVGGPNRLVLKVQTLVDWNKQVYKEFSS